MWEEVWGREKVLGEVWESVLGCGDVLGEVWVSVLRCGESEGRRGKVCWGLGRCEKVCWDVGGVGKDWGSVEEVMKKCFGAWGKV